jgi:hypothetical protein
VMTVAWAPSDLANVSDGGVLSENSIRPELA